ncbi:MAG: PfkB family carbohydrate kinase [Acidobacteriota bacterium]
MSLVVTGTAAFDSVKTPSGSRENVLGGSAIYFSLAASFFGPVKVVAVVGEDYPQEALRMLEDRSIDTKGIVRIPGKTFRWRGEYGQDLNEAKTLETQLNVLQDFNPSLPDEYRSARFLFLANIDPLLQGRVKSQLHSPLLIAADTMNFWIEGRREELLNTLGQVDLAVINNAEAKMLARDNSLPRAVSKIMQMGPKTVIVKRGEFGVMLFGEEGVFAAPAFPVAEVCDPTGAGDTFAGGLMGYLACADRLDAGTIRQAVICGSVMASFNVEDFSFDRLLSLEKREIKARLARFEALMRFDPPEWPG